MQQLIDSISRAFGMFDSNGLRFNTDHLTAVKKQIPFWDLTKQSQYVDSVTMKAVQSHQEIMIGADESSMDNARFPLNTTAVGNIAYIALHSYSEALQYKAKKCLDRYKTWAANQGW
jgi:hypothetical protein